LSAKGKEKKKRKAAWAGVGKDWWAAGPPGQKGKKVSSVFSFSKTIPIQSFLFISSFSETIPIQTFPFKIKPKILQTFSQNFIHF
jgi:hypothetical protein